jgi:hypothetical protein
LEGVTGRKYTKAEMTTENSFQNAEQMHRDMVMKTQNCFQNAEQMHRDMEMKTENCFQNADYADALPCR